jgi:uncharacterized membrane protein
MADSRSRLTAVDALRGLVMVIMALDHTRDFFNAEAMQFAPVDLARTTPALFLTRWVTHICAPVFVLTAGMGARLRLLRGGGDPPGVSRFLWTRGLWLIAIEVTVMRLAMNFTVDSRYPLLLIILWALGWSMIALAALIRLPVHAVGAVGAGIVLLHNTLDGVRAADLGAAGWLWRILHEQGLVMIGPMPAVAGYPLLPWIGVMALGYWIAGAFEWPGERRLRAFRFAGAAGIAGFLALRFLNGYGDPSPWSVQGTPSMTVVSFLNTTKYPPSLAFLLMTLGPALLILAALERWSLGGRHPLVAFGRVPFAYYVVHFWLLHLAAAVLAFVRYGAASLSFLWYPLPSMGGPREVFPPDLGVSLPWTYVAWVLLVVALYWPARWLADVKRRRRDWWISYV